MNRIFCLATRRVGVVFVVLQRGEQRATTDSWHHLPCFLLRSLPGLFTNSHYYCVEHEARYTYCGCLGLKGKASIVSSACTTQIMRLSKGWNLCQTSCTLCVGGKAVEKFGMRVRALRGLIGKYRAGRQYSVIRHNHNACKERKGAKWSIKRGLCWRDVVVSSIQLRLLSSN